MSNASSNWLDLPLAAPRALFIALWILYGLALLALWLSAVPRVLLILPPLLAAFALKRLADRPRGLLRLREDARIFWLNANIDADSNADAGAHSEQELRWLSVATRGPLRVLRLAADARVITAIYCNPGNLDAQQQRRLDLWLQRFDPLNADAATLEPGR